MNNISKSKKPTSAKVSIVAFDLRATNAQITSTCSVKETIQTETPIINSEKQKK